MAPSLTRSHPPVGTDEKCFARRYNYSRHLTVEAKSLILRANERRLRYSTLG
jgi:hypothetical protein